MKRGKYICKELKTVRRKIAEENDIPLEIKECTYEGPCRGTCPRCEAEVRYLENSLAHRLKMGKVATIAGLTLGLASCGGSSVETQRAASLENNGTNSATQRTASLPSEPEGPETSIEVPDVGGLEVVGVVEELPPPQIDSDFILGMAIEPVEVMEGEEEYVVVDEEPEFPGGKDALERFIRDNLRYPQMALDNRVQGKVYVTFVVEEDGSISNPKLLRDIGVLCGEEAIRMVKSMPKWKPGMKDGKPVRVQYNLPVRFELPPMIEVGTPGGIPEPAPFYKPDPPVESPKGPDAPTQQLKVDGVKVIVR